ncbi:hypothetical protein CTI12_AA427690 [Artemisia annua]|uniref:Uncharacterized protein n=1 Tax=Artemisia annua TaxID=35608 RepID=A0A2U1LR33_ARTAN|nr:hypothetical protein CTI12_AA427690 [Artemisia annua]
MRLREIRFGEEFLKVFVAFDRKNPGEYRRSDNSGGVRRNNMKAEHDRSGKNGYSMKRDERRFVDVVNGYKSNTDSKQRVMEERKEECRNHDDNLEAREEKENLRMIEVGDDEVNMAFFNRCLLGEVKNPLFLSKLPSFCDEEGLNNVEIKTMDGLEIMMVFDNSETVTNILNNINHGMRRWVHKMRRWSKHYILPGRLTWVNVMGVPVSCWSEHMFKNIVALHGRVIGTSNCNLEGNQNLIVAKVQLHTRNKGLINKSLYIKVFGKNFKINIVEEVGDIMEVDWEEDGNESKIEHMNRDTEKQDENNDMVISDSESNEDSSGGETDSNEDSSGGDSLKSDLEEGGNEAEDETAFNLRPEDDGGRKMEEDEVSRISGMSRVWETTEEAISKKEKATVDVDKMGHVKDIGPQLTKDDSPNQNKINEDGPSEARGPVRIDWAVNESSNEKIRRTRWAPIRRVAAGRCFMSLIIARYFLVY